MLIRIVVPTASATAASSWLAMPNIGQMVLMLPVQMKYDQPKTTQSVETIDPGIHPGCASGLYARPRNSPSRNRATRVPVSIVVRMKSASNMIAKWYQ
jgi:hypothetical protein